MGNRVTATTVQLLINNVYTSATDGAATGVDLQDYPNGQEMVAILMSDVMAGVETLDVKLAESADDSSYADISGAAFAQVAQTGITEAIRFIKKKRYLRVEATNSSTSGGAYGVCMVADKKYITS